MIIRSKFSTIFRIKWPTLRSLSVAEFSSMKETGDVVDSNSDLCSGDSSVQSDSAETVTSTSEVQPSSAEAKSGLEKAIRMFGRVEEMSESDSVQTSKTGDGKPVSFASMLRRSKLIAIGKPEGRVVVGTVIETMNDDLYIDFGGKFHCVCKVPRSNTEWVNVFLLFDLVVF